MAGTEKKVSKIVVIDMYWDLDGNGGTIQDVKPDVNDGMVYSWKCFSCGNKYKATYKEFLCKMEFLKSDTGMNATCPNCGYLSTSKFNKYSDVEYLDDDMQEFFTDFQKSYKYGVSYAVFISKCHICNSIFSASYNTLKARKTLFCQDCYTLLNKVEKYGSLAEVRPDVIPYYSAENKIDIHMRPACKRPADDDKVFLTCPRCGKFHNKRIDSVINYGAYCSNCTSVINRQSEGKIQTLDVAYPNVATMYDESGLNELPSSMISAKGNMKAYFQCNVGVPHIFKKEVAAMTQAADKGNSGCPICAGFQIVEGVNDFKFRNPTIAEFWDYENNNGVLPEEVYYRSEKKYNFVCSHGHTFSADPLHLLRSVGTSTLGCPVCHGKKIIAGVNDLASQVPEKVLEWNYNINTIDPTTIPVSSNKEANFHCRVCGKVYTTTIYNWVNDLVVCCEDCRNRTWSLAEKELSTTIKGWGFDIEENVYIHPSELEKFNLDIVVRNKGIAIEYNGLYWHTDVIHYNYYHKKKLEAAKKVGFSLYTIWEDDYKDKKNIILDSLKYKLGISDKERVNARDCYVSEETIHDVRDFLKSNSLSGSTLGFCYLTLRKYKDNSIQAVMIYNQLDNMNGTITAEITRYCTNCILRGGFSKLINYIESSKRYISIQAYSDSMFSDGDLYKKVGFVIADRIKPDFWYLINNRRVLSKLITRRFFQDSPKYLYIDNASEDDLAKVNNISKIYDAGKLLWVKELY